MRHWLGTSLIVAAFLAEISIACHPAGLPVLSRAVEMKLTGQPRAISDLKVDGAGRLYLSDSAAGRVEVFSPEGKPLQNIGAPGVGHGRFRKPLWLSITGETLAVLDSADGGPLQFFSLKTGQFLSALHLPPSYLAQGGFFITPARVVFTGLGFPAMPVPGASVEAWFLFSTSWNGKALRINDSRKFRPGEYDRSREARWANWSYSTPWGPGRWAVTHGLPRQITLLDGEGRTIGTSKAEPAGSSAIPAYDGGSPEGAMQTLAKTPHVIGLIPAGQWLGVVWQHRHEGIPFEAEWMDGRLESAGSQPLFLPFPLAPGDTCRVAATDSLGRVYLIVYHEDGDFTFSTRLYVMRLTLPAGRP
jgi:hypothetical protein